MTQLFPLLLVTACAWYWWHASRAREVAIAAARRACQQCDVQFLDQTVAVQGLRCRRDAQGHWHVWRKFSFEFSVDGANRGQGFVIIQGDRLYDMHLNLDADRLSARVH